MRTSKLIQVFRILSEPEFKSLHKFLKTETIEGKQHASDSLQFFNILKPFYPLFDSEKLSKANLFAKLYPHEEFVAGRIEKLTMHLFRRMEQFIISHHYKVDRDLQQQLALSAFYQNRGLSNLSEINIKKYRKSLSGKEEGSITTYYDLFLLEKERKNAYAILQDPTNPPRFSETLKRLDDYYIYEKLEQACEMLSFHRFLFPINFGDGFILLDHLTPLLEAEYFDDPVIKVYYSAYRLLRAEKEDKAHFLTFEKKLNTYEKYIASEPLKSLKAIIRNYCVIQYHSGNEDYLEVSFKIYQQHLKEGYLYNQNKIMPSTLGNIVLAGLRLRAFDWVLQFLKAHQFKITGTSTPEVVYQFNLANYYFYTTQFETALDCLADTYEDTYYKLSAKRLEIKVYYEMNHPLLLSKMDAFKIYIYRLQSSHTTEKQKEGNRNFIDLLKQICHPSTFQNGKRIERLTEKINALKFITEKDWLLEKLSASNKK